MGSEKMERHPLMEMATPCPSPVWPSSDCCQGPDIDRCSPWLVSCCISCHDGPFCPAPRMNCEVPERKLLATGTDFPPPCASCLLNPRSETTASQVSLEQEGRLPVALGQPAKQERWTGRRMGRTGEQEKPGSSTLPASPADSLC